MTMHFELGSSREDRFRGRSTLVVRTGTDDGVETVVNAVGPLRLYEPVMSSGAFAVAGEVPDKYGEGVHWVYLVVRRE